MTERPQPGHRNGPGRPDGTGSEPRLFIAVPIPGDVVDSIEELVESVRSLGVPNGGRDVRWVRLEGLHVTLRFLGPTPDGRVGAVADATRAAAGAHDPFDVAIGRGGAFPTPARPRALWLDIPAGAAQLAAMAATVDDGLRARGWELDERPLRPHLTLARSDGIRAGALIAARLIEAAADLELRFRADRIALFESRTGGGPAHYESLEVVPLRTTA